MLVGFLQRTLAVACVVVTLALGFFAASPALHDQLHAGQHASPDDGCAVVLFAGGVSLALPLIALPPPSADWTELRAVVSAEVLLDSPRYLLQPERGPPLA